MATDDPEVPLSIDEESCPAGCPHDLTAHSRRLGCWLCDCTFGRARPAAGGQGDEAAGSSRRYVQGWFLFVGPDGELSKALDAARISIGATRAGRVRVTVPEGLDIAPGLADHVARRITDAAREARARAAWFTPGTDGQGSPTVAATRAGRVRVTVPEGPGMDPGLAESFAGQVTEAAQLAREHLAGPGEE
jgi:hypothetical protein